MHPEWHLKVNFNVTFSENLSDCWTNWHELLKAKFKLTNETTNIFLKTCKKILICWVLTNLIECFLIEPPFWPHFWFLVPHIRFFNFCQDLEQLSIYYILSVNGVKKLCLYLYLFWRYKVLNILYTVTHMHIHAHRPILKIYFLRRRSLKNI